MHLHLYQETFSQRAKSAAQNEAVSAVSSSLGYVETSKLSDAAVSMPRNALILISRWIFCHVVRRVVIANSYWTVAAAR